jgi:PiT family inorganic phosphate transporter
MTPSGRTDSAYVKPTGPKPTDKTFAAITVEAQSIADTLAATTDINSLSREQRTSLRTDIYLVDESDRQASARRI